jgi:hypothetical protein
MKPILIATALILLGSVAFLNSYSDLINITDFSTDKEIYQSKEKMNLTLDVYCSKNLENVDVKIFGIKDRGNNYKLNIKKVVNLTSGLNSLSFSYNTPSCYGCAGINPGFYNLTASVSYNEINKTETKTIEMKS